MKNSLPKKYFFLNQLFFIHPLIYSAIGDFFLKFNSNFNEDFKKISCEIKKLDSNEIDIDLINKLILAEDHRFLMHYGIDFISILRAIKSIIIKRKYQGASTIEQQLVRVLTFRYERTFRRKIREQILATKISSKFCKKSIAACYLNICYFGFEYVGLKNIQKYQYASSSGRNYFIASLPKYPIPRNETTLWKFKINNRIAYIKKREIKYKSNCFLN